MLIQFTKPTTLTLVTDFDEPNVTETIHFCKGEERTVFVTANSDPDHANIQFNDGSLALDVPRHCFLTPN